MTRCFVAGKAKWEAWNKQKGEHLFTMCQSSLYVLFCILDLNDLIWCVLQARNKAPLKRSTSCEFKHPQITPSFTLASGVSNTTVTSRHILRACAAGRLQSYKKNTPNCTSNRPWKHYVLIVTKQSLHCDLLCSINQVPIVPLRRFCAVEE